MKQQLSVLLLALIVLVVIFYLQCEYNGSYSIVLMINATGLIDTTSTNVTVIGDRTGFVPLSKSEVDGVEKFVLFIGYDRSGHSIVGAMMDAHPNIVIAHEYHAIKQCVLHGPAKLQSKAVLFNGIYENSYKHSKGGRRSETVTKSSTRKGYNLNVNTQWQGSFSKLRVIGDKDAGPLTILFHEHSKETTRCFNLLKKTIRIPIVVFHVVRNPFDMIATRLALNHKIPNTREKLLVGKKLRIEKREIMDVAEKFFQNAKAVLKLQTSHVIRDLVVVEIHIEDFIKHPREHINKICEALGVPCPMDYVEACHEKTFGNISKSRHIVEWDGKVVKNILTEMKKYPFFSLYGFDS